jgi:hypothetical protein
LTIGRIGDVAAYADAADLGRDLLCSCFVPVEHEAAHTECRERPCGPGAQT